MDEIIEKITDLNINGYYDKSSGYVTVWFHSAVSTKPDIVAYLTSDMDWDVREVVSESSKVLVDKEVVTVVHKPLNIEAAEGTFDKIVRKMIDGVIENEERELSPHVTKMKEILDNNSYGVMILN